MNNKKTTLLVSLGAGLEYYDFIIYGLLASYLGQIFFSNPNNVMALLQAFSVFALGYLARPIGGLIFGNLGDRFGRKNTFLFSLLLMAATTLMIGFLPSYQHWGLLATCALVLLRILQGLAFGAELPGTITLLTEHANKINRGITCSIALSSISIGATLGSLLLFGLNKFLTSEQMLSYGWRIPFWLGGALAIISYLIRKNINETPLFIKNSQKPQTQWPIYSLLQQHPKSIALGIGISLFGACLVIFAITFPSYLSRFYAYKTSDIYFYVGIGFIWSALILPFIGWISDRVGRMQLLLGISVLTLLGGHALFGLLNFGNAYALAVFILLYQTVVSTIVCCYLPILAGLFPTSVRFTGVALCYNLVYSIAGLTPLLLSKLVNSAQETHYTLLFFMGLAGVTVMSVLIAMMQKSKRNFEEEWSA